MPAKRSSKPHHADKEEDYVYPTLNGFPPYSLLDRITRLVETKSDPRQTAKINREATDIAHTITEKNFGKLQPIYKKYGETETLLIILDYMLRTTPPEYTTDPELPIGKLVHVCGLFFQDDRIMYAFCEPQAPDINNIAIIFYSSDEDRAQLRSNRNALHTAIKQQFPLFGDENMKLMDNMFGLRHLKRNMKTDKGTYNYPDLFPANCLGFGKNLRIIEHTLSFLYNTKERCQQLKNKGRPAPELFSDGVSLFRIKFVETVQRGEKSMRTFSQHFIHFNEDPPGTPLTDNPWMRLPPENRNLILTTMCPDHQTRIRLFEDAVQLVTTHMDTSTLQKYYVGHVCETVDNLITLMTYAYLYHTTYYTSVWNRLFSCYQVFKIQKYWNKSQTDATTVQAILLPFAQFVLQTKEDIKTRDINIFRHNNCTIVFETMGTIMTFKNSPRNPAADRLADEDGESMAGTPHRRGSDDTDSIHSEHDFHETDSENENNFFSMRYNTPNDRIEHANTAQVFDPYDPSVPN